MDAARVPSRNARRVRGILAGLVATAGFAGGRAGVGGGAPLEGGEVGGGEA